MKFYLGFLFHFLICFAPSFGNASEPPTRMQTEFIRENNQIRIRKFFFYNSDNSLATLIVDDGQSEDCEDLAAVSERHITRFTYIYGPDGKLVDSVRESYYDFNERKESLQLFTQNIYDQNCWLVEQKIYGPDSKHKYSLTFQYDSQGREIKSIDQARNITRTEYDKSGRKTLILVRDSQGREKSKKYTYDEEGNVIQEEEQLPDGTSKFATYQYDSSGKKIASLDKYGNATEFTYDGLGRLAGVLMPPVLDLDDNLIRPAITYEYGPDGNLACAIDPNGQATRYTYFTKDKPSTIQYADGTMEAFQYDEKGELISHISRWGCRTEYKRDFLGRIVKKEIFSLDGELDRFLENSYNSFHLLACIDSHGNANLYTYDFSGRQLAVLKQTAEHSKEIRYEYTASGEVSWIKQLQGDDESTIYSSKDQAPPSRESKVDDQPELLKEETGYFNGRGQFVSQIAVTDETGCVTINTMDALGRIEKVVRKSPYGYLMSQLDFRYDAAGNKVKEVRTFLPIGSPPIIETTLWKYGPHNRIELMVEKAATEEQVIGRYIYSQGGQLKKIRFSNGITHYNEYDRCGRLLQAYSSDDSFSLKYFYDSSGALSHIQDMLNGHLLGSLDNKDSRDEPPQQASFWEETWQSIKSAISRTWESIKQTAAKAFQFFNFEVSILNFLRKQIENIAEVLVGRTFLDILGLHPHGIITGTYGEKELHPKVRITLINGILNVRSDHQDSLAMISNSHGGCKIHYVFRASLGWTWDLIRCAMSKLGYVSMEARMLADLWKKMIKELGGLGKGGTVIHYAHSIGGTETASARNLMDAKELKMIRVISFGSATMISNEGFQSVVNYVSRRDGVCLLDPVGYMEGLLCDCSNIVFVGSLLGIPFVDHMFGTETYRQIILMLGRQFIELYGLYA